MQNLLRNLYHGLRLLALRPSTLGRFAVTVDQALVLALLHAFIYLGIGDLVSAPGSSFAPLGVEEVALMAMLVWLSAYLLARARRLPQILVSFPVVFGAVTPPLSSLAAALVGISWRAESEWGWNLIWGATAALAALFAYALFMTIRLVSGWRAWVALVWALVLAAGIGGTLFVLAPSGFWLPPADTPQEETEPGFVPESPEGLIHVRGHAPGTPTLSREA